MSFKKKKWKGSIPHSRSPKTSSHIQLTWHEVFFHNVWLEKGREEERDLLISLNHRSQFKMKSVPVEY